jgi:hypothetical protein
MANSTYMDNIFALYDISGSRVPRKKLHPDGIVLKFNRQPLNIHVYMFTEYRNIIIIKYKYMFI